jgi:hypothetical protein
MRHRGQQVTIIGHECPSRHRAGGARCPVAGRIPFGLQLAQAAVWDWQITADRFQVDEGWLRAFGIDVPAPWWRSANGSGVSTRTTWALSTPPPIPASTAAIASNVNTGC